MIDFNSILKEELETISLLKDGVVIIEAESKKGDNAYGKWKLRYELLTIQRDLKVKEVILERTKQEIEAQAQREAEKKKKIITRPTDIIKLK